MPPRFPRQGLAGVLTIVVGTLLSACDTPTDPRSLSPAGSTALNDAAGIADSIPADSLTIAAVAPNTPVGRVLIYFASGAIDQKKWQFATGGTEQMGALVYDVSNRAITGVPVVYRSSDSTIIAIDSATGVATAVSAGSATMSVTAGGKTSTSGKISVTGTTVTPPPTTPPPTTPPPTTPPPTTPPPTTPSSSPATVALTVVRFDNKSGSAIVSSGVPLQPGVLFAGQEGNVRITIGGVEQAAYVSGLPSLHPDGSLRSVLVQFSLASLASTTPQSGTLDIGTARPAAMVLSAMLQTPGTAVSGAPGGLPQAAALPSDPDYLVATDLVGATLTSVQTTALGGVFARYESDWKSYGDLMWNTEGARWDGNYYDRALIFQAEWVRTGDPKYWSRANQIAYNYRTQYLTANNYIVSPHWSQLEGLEKHYLLTGDEMSRRAVLGTAETLNGFTPSTYMTAVDGEGRIAARVLHSQLLAWRLTPNGSAPAGYPVRDWQGRTEAAIARIAAWQSSNGSWIGINQVCSGQLNYMTGLLDDALIKTFDYFQPRTTSQSAMRTQVKGMIVKSVDYLWTTQWLPSSRSFNYVSVSCPMSKAGISVGSPGPAPDLNELIVNAFGWAYRQTGNIAYRNSAETMWAGGVTQAYLQGTKQFNENYTSSFRYTAYR